MTDFGPSSLLFQTSSRYIRLLVPLSATFTGNSLECFFPQHLRPSFQIPLRHPILYPTLLLLLHTLPPSSILLDENRSRLPAQRALAQILCPHRTFPINKDTMELWVPMTVWTVKWKVVEMRYWHSLLGMYRAIGRWLAMAKDWPRKYQSYSQRLMPNLRYDLSSHIKFDSLTIALCRNTLLSLLAKQTVSPSGSLTTKSIHYYILLHQEARPWNLMVTQVWLPMVQDIQRRRRWARPVT